MRMTCDSYLGVLYGTKAFKNKNPNSNPGIKNIIILVRLETGDKGRRSQRRLLTKFSIAGIQTDGY